MKTKAHQTDHRVNALLRQQSGFTLIEVLMAMVIVSIGLLGTAVLTMGIMGSNKSSSEVTMATTLAQDELEEIRNEGFDTAPAVGAADSDSGYGTISGYTSFRRVVSTASVGSLPSTDTKAVTVTVYWDNNNRSISLTTIITQ